VLKKALQVLPRCHALILEDYGKGLFDQELVDSLLTAARKKGVPTAVDPNIHNPLNWNGATLVKPNRLEAFGALGQPDSARPEDWIAAGEELLLRWGCHYLLLTLGENGMILFQPDHPPFSIPSRAREVYDVSGAGDTVISLLASALAAGLPGNVAAELANLGAGIVVGKLGTATVTPAELIDAARHHG
jgi:D-beta-D-heptose 7-phosphate kinase/D-beta-D-heptose 1-phosphate adenosyltransferase